MHQIKIFKGLESELSVLENEVNAWLAEEGGRVLQVVGNIAQQSITTMGKQIGLSKTDFVPSDVLLVMVYDKLS
jgi:hypothetical protein